MKKNHSGHANRAQSLVEFALVLPLFLLLMLGLIDFGRLLFSYISLANGAREMARVVAISSSTDAQAVDAFNNLTIVGGSMDPLTDSVVIKVYDGTGAQQGLAKTCQLPLTYASCTTLPARSNSNGAFNEGWIDISATYVFHFNPLFQNKLAGVIDVSLMQPLSTLTTTVRTYIE